MVSSRAPQRPKRAPWRMKITTTAMALVIASIITVSLDEIAMQPTTSPPAGAARLAGNSAQSWDFAALLSSLEGGNAPACAPASSLH